MLNFILVGNIYDYIAALYSDEGNKIKCCLIIFQRYTYTFTKVNVIHPSGLGLMNNNIK